MLDISAIFCERCRYFIKDLRIDHANLDEFWITLCESYCDYFDEAICICYDRNLTNMVDHLERMGYLVTTERPFSRFQDKIYIIPNCTILDDEHVLFCSKRCVNVD